MELYKDKALHFVAGLIVGALVLIAARFFAPPPVHAYWAFLGAFLAGVLFEAYTRYESAPRASGTEAPRAMRIWDGVATAAGGLTVTVLYSLHNH